MPNQEENCYSVYAHYFQNGKVYFGVTKRDPEKRWAGGLGYRGQKRLFAAIVRFGWENITHIVLLSKLDRATAEAAEKFLIANNKATDPAHGYNYHPGGFICAEEATERARLKLLGRKRSPEFCERIRVRALGRKASPELRAKLSLAHKGQKLSAENVENLRRINTGKKRSEETCRKLSDNKRKFYGDPRNRARASALASNRQRAVAQLSRSGEEVHRYGSIKEAAAAIGCCRTSITNAMRVRKDGATYGRIAHGFMWRYV